MTKIRSALRAFSWSIVFVNIGVTVFATILLLLDMATRNLGGRALPGTYDLSEISMLIITATALIWLDAERDNIGFTIIVDRLSPAKQTIVEVIWRLASIPLFAFMAYYGFQRMLVSRESNEARMGILELAVWPMRLLVVLTFVTLIIFAIFYIADALTSKKITSIIERDHEHEELG